MHRHVGLVQYTRERRVGQMKDESACDCAGPPLARRANHEHCGALVADILCQDSSANVY